MAEGGILCANFKESSSSLLYFLFTPLIPSDKPYHANKHTKAFARSCSSVSNKALSKDIDYKECQSGFRSVQLS